MLEKMNIRTSKGRAIWLRGLLAASISGISNGLTTGLSANMIAPSSFNMGDGLVSTMQLVAVSSVISGVLGAAAYLKQSPLPPNSTLDLPTLKDRT